MFSSSMWVQVENVYKNNAVPGSIQQEVSSLPPKRQIISNQDKQNFIVNKNAINSFIQTSRILTLKLKFLLKI